MKILKNIFCLTVSVCVLSACGKKDADKIAEGQACLNSSTSDTVTQCIDKVSGIESPGAYVIRCAAMFIAEGFNDPARLSSAYAQMTSTGTGTSSASSSTAAMSVLAFHSSSTPSVNSTNAQTTAGYCNKSGSKGLILLSSISSMATTMVSFAGLVASNQGDITTAISTAKDDPATQAVVGDAAVAAYTSTCTAGQTSNQQFCDQFSSVITNAGGTSASSACIGKQLMYYYNDPTATPPSC